MKRLTKFKISAATIATVSVLALSACTLPPSGKAKIVNGFDSVGPAASGSSASSTASGSQYGQAQTQGLGQQSQFSGQAIYDSNAQVGNDNGSVSGNTSQAAALGNTPTIIHFAFDSYAVDATAQSKLAPSVTYLLQHPNTPVVIAGHTDPRGSQEYNFHLGQRRADAVMNYFLQQGVSAKQLCTVSYGELQPAATPAEFHGNWRKAYELDRRVVLTFNQTCKGAKA